MPGVVLIEKVTTGGVRTKFIVRGKVSRRIEEIRQRIERGVRRTIGEQLGFIQFSQSEDHRLVVGDAPIVDEPAIDTLVGQILSKASSSARREEVLRLTVRTEKCPTIGEILLGRKIEPVDPPVGPGAIAGANFEMHRDGQVFVSGEIQSVKRRTVIFCTDGFPVEQGGEGVRIARNEEFNRLLFSSTERHLLPMLIDQRKRDRGREIRPNAHRRLTGDRQRLHDELVSESSLEIGRKRETLTRMKIRWL